MRWIVVILVCVLLILIALPVIGSNVVNLPRPHDPFPLVIRTQLDTLDDERREITRVAGKVKMIRNTNAGDLSQEKQIYDELAAEANDLLKTAGRGLDLHTVDVPYMSQKFEEDRLIPRAKELFAKLNLMQVTELGAADSDHVLSVVEKLLDRGTSYLKLVVASDTHSITIAKTQLDGMKWLPWSEL